MLLVLLGNPSGLVRIFPSQLLKIRHSRLEILAHICLVLARTESRSKEHAGPGSSTGGRNQEMHSCNKYKACACIFFPLHKNITENFLRVKKGQDHDLTSGSKGSHHEPRSLKRASTSDTSRQFSVRQTIPTNRASSIGTI